jgi:hypothetical protein
MRQTEIPDLSPEAALVQCDKAIAPQQPHFLTDGFQHPLLPEY